MATIERRSRDGSVSYLVRWRDPARKQRSKSFAKRKDAVNYMTTVTGDIQRGAYVDPKAGRITLGDWWDQWWPTVRKGRNTKDRDTRSFRNHARPVFGDVPIDRLERHEIQAWVDRLSESGKSSETVHKAYGCVRKALDAAVGRKLLRANTAVGVKLPKIVHRKPRVITVAQITGLADTIQARFRLFVLIGCYCGLRAGELAGLQWGEVNLDVGELVVARQVVLDDDGHPAITTDLKSTAAHRHVPVPRFLCDALREAKGDATADDLIFPDSLGGPLNLNNFRQRVWNNTVSVAWLPRRFLIHEMRHTAVSLWIAAGATPVEVREWAGHASIYSIFDKYGHLFGRDHGQEIADRLHMMATPARRSKRQLRTV
jgi:integrase